MINLTEVNYNKICLSKRPDLANGKEIFKGHTVRGMKQSPLFSQKTGSTSAVFHKNPSAKNARAGINGMRAASFVDSINHPYTTKWAIRAIKTTNFLYLMPFWQIFT
jgi:hypothetical protein